MKKISAIILAAGVSSRMGKLKQITEIKGKIMIEIILEKVKAQPFYEIILVLGYKHELIQKSLKTRVDKVVINNEYEKGISTSIKSGVLSISDDSEAFAIFLADQPFIKGETIKKIIEEFNKRECLILAPLYNNEIGHPVIFHRKLIPEIMKLTGDVGAKTIIKKFKENAYFLEVDDEGVFIDIDTPEDLNETLKKLTS
jgi:molybdenum cofactor cytidylyltransferase